MRDEGGCQTSSNSAREAPNATSDNTVVLLLFLLLLLPPGGWG